MGVTLALRALGLGDLLTALPALRALRAARPDDRLVLAAPGWLRPIVDLACCVDELHETPGLGRLHWTGPPPDLAVNLHGRGPQSIADLLATGAARLITHAHPDFPIPGPSWSPTAHEVRRWCDLLAGAGIPADPARLDLAPPPEGTPHAGAVVVHPGGSSAARRWPADRFAEVAAYLRGHADRVLVTGDAAERPLAESVAARAGLGPDAVLAGELDLRELAATVAGAALVVCSDTGVGHLATAFGTPSVVLFGPNPPAWWGPPPQRRRHVALWAGHIGDPHGDTVDPGLLALGTDEVIAAVRAQLTRWPPRARQDSPAPS
ncbi:glycosyltransferase family 9 protein [Nocardia farcinica]|uniref:glycosyltransferase family 9 protein n=1 Tax=Nocardia farcinica TaxID=37329 RepID=UPI0018942A1A|nr:glycosyltransferase family 9 protein [Nocardia farcinica]MBF6290325.1 glycosyltransferase family 9 protein [Nocardia farcinica]MBF6371902.1 glycosyltransferase family 9 protein [Nocardia farcinica]MBF6377498.1 glycosyltransferase family 9 protein [Nocardia farcinica]